MAYDSWVINFVSLPWPIGFMPNNSTKIIAYAIYVIYMLTKPYVTRQMFVHDDKYMMKYINTSPFVKTHI